ncbi:MAG: glycosyltransferase [Gammaproteobacteria bacterium]|nr:glycosyltransferase [Gammaproteobacteria bacterium]
MPDALQLCPNDYPPFFEVCVGHAKALESMGFRVRTVFFRARGGAPGPSAAHGVVYATPRDLPGLVAGVRPDLLISHRHRAYRVGVPLARRVGVPTHVVVAHEPGMFGPFTRRLRRRLAGPTHARFAGVSEFVAADLAATGIQSPLVLPNPIDLDSLAASMESRSDARAALGVPASAFAVGVVGRLHPKKDPLRALRAFEAYRRDNESACLVFVGDGMMRERIEQEAGAGVVVAGFRPDIRTLLGAFDVVLSCAGEREAAGVALLEAMAAGIPVVLADRPGPRRVVGDCGMYFDTDDQLVAALRHLAAHPAPATVERARQRLATRFSVEALADRYRSVLVASTR